MFPSQDMQVQVVDQTTHPLKCHSFVGLDGQSGCSPLLGKSTDPCDSKGSTHTHTLSYSIQPFLSFRPPASPEDCLVDRTSRKDGSSELMENTYFVGSIAALNVNIWSLGHTGLHMAKRRKVLHLS